MARVERAEGTPRREKPRGKLARFTDAQKNNNDLLADFERLLLREHEDTELDPRRQDVIHPSEMAKSDWCPRSTYLRIVRARAGTLTPGEAHHFQLENIFEEGHEYHRKWQSRAQRMGRLFGMWKCENCGKRWGGNSPVCCPDCAAPVGALTYCEVPLHDDIHLIHGLADGLIIGADSDDVLIEVKSIGEGTVRMDLPAVLGKHTYEVEDVDWGRTKKVLDHRGVWKDISRPFGPHLRQGLIYLRLLGEMNAAGAGYPVVDRIMFLYEYKPTSQVKAFYVARNDEAVQELWDSAADIVWALEGNTPPRCIEQRKGPCKSCQQHSGQETGHDAGTPSTGRRTQGKPARRSRTGEGAAPPTPPAEDGSARAARRPVRPRGQRADRSVGRDDEMGGLLGRTARRSRS